MLLGENKPSAQSELQLVCLLCTHNNNNDLLHKLISVQLTTTDVVFKWRLTTLGLFTMKSMYLD
jgi:hypothetical protein